MHTVEKLEQIKIQSGSVPYVYKSSTSQVEAENSEVQGGFEASLGCMSSLKIKKERTLRHGKL